MRQGASFSLDDPRPIKREAPYTYYLPSEQRLAAITVGDQVQLLFRSAAPNPKYAVERMWVLVQLVSDDDLAGKLLSEPFDMPGLKRGERVAFQRHHVISVIFADKEKSDRLVEAPQRDYWERCIVAACLMTLSRSVSFIAKRPDQCPKVIGIKTVAGAFAAMRAASRPKMSTSDKLPMSRLAQCSIGTIVGCL